MDPRKSVLLIETGIGCSFYSWYPFVDKIKADFTVILYHRAGYGNSTATTKARTTEYISEELNSLVEYLGITEPFLLMGHSYGGLCAQHFVKKYPEKIKGLILLDSTSYNFRELYHLNLPVMNSLISLEKMIESNVMASQRSSKGLREEFKGMIEKNKEDLSEHEGKKFEEFITDPTLFQTIANDFGHWDESGRMIKEMGAFPDIPLVVIARDKEESIKPFIEHKIPEEEAIMYEDVWRKLQVELSRLSTKGVLIVAEKSDHEIHIDRPDVIIQGLKTLGDA
ncbi:alpha/beta fold hydrolase [Pseudalkalibacillus caeni]|uniref:Alpha/beta hydrolase n=1 Tax=Exobacillus caeni TaxID=2574798 RepID=A0A5R9F024_9BACL|nr:alpha/beta hydrolase [Pseudalkalibacillus caeni]TLS36952.1 alpha/beta hydrolase [Pseudalkalibacillus caeni]